LHRMQGDLRAFKCVTVSLILNAIGSCTNTMIVKGDRSRPQMD